MQKHPFSPIIFKDTKILILGSFPSISSFENSFYYANPKNQFWNILKEVTNYPINNRDQKIWLLKTNFLGLWDMVSSCKRENSLDSDLKEIEVNNIPLILDKYPNIEKLLFTGRKAQTLFEDNFSQLKIKRDYLPSPSTAYASISFDEKVKIYKERVEL